MPKQNSKHFYHFSGKDMLAMTKMKFALLTDFRISMDFPTVSIPHPAITMPRQCPRPQEAPTLAAASGGINLTRSQIHGNTTSYNF